MEGIKPFEELTIKDDYMFKRVMSNKRLCKRMLEKILEFKIRDIKYLEDEKSLKNIYFSKGIRLDIYVEDDKNTVYNIEMQVRHLPDNSLYKRIRYYQSVIDTDILNVGEFYTKLKDTFIIFICPFKILDGSRHKYTFKNICCEDKSIDMKDGATKILLSTKGVIDDVSEGMKAFLNYVDGIMSQDEFVADVEKAVNEVKEREQERVSYMTYAMKMLEERNEGKKEGIEEGREQGIISTVIELLRAKQPLSLIEQVSKFSKERIIEIGKMNGIALTQ